MPPPIRAVAPQTSFGSTQAVAQGSAEGIELFPLSTGNNSERRIDEQHPRAFCPQNGINRIKTGISPTNGAPKMKEAWVVGGTSTRIGAQSLVSPYDDNSGSRQKSYFPNGTLVTSPRSANSRGEANSAPQDPPQGEAHGNRASSKNSGTQKPKKSGCCDGASGTFKRLLRCLPLCG